MPKASERGSDVMKHLNKEQWRIASRGLPVLLVAVLICISMIAFSVMNKSVAWHSSLTMDQKIQTDKESKPTDSPSYFEPDDSTDTGQ